MRSARRDARVYMHPVMVPQAQRELSRLEDFRYFANLVRLHEHPVQIADLPAWIECQRRLCGSHPRIEIGRQTPPLDLEKIAKRLALGLTSTRYNLKV